jgi:hypothetical protein
LDQLGAQLAGTAGDVEVELARVVPDVYSDVLVNAELPRDEPVLRQRVVDAERRWSVEGQRERVDAARATVRRLADRSPKKTWRSYLDRFDPDSPEIFFRTDPDLGRYVPSAFAPADVVDREWYSITLEREELAALSAAAPADLRSRFQPDGDSDVERLSFEYASVGVSRAWLVSEVFGSRAWRLPPSRNRSATVPRAGRALHVLRRRARSRAGSHGDLSGANRHSTARVAHASTRGERHQPRVRELPAAATPRRLGHDARPAAGRRYCRSPEGTVAAAPLRDRRHARGRRQRS